MLTTKSLGDIDDNGSEWYSVTRDNRVVVGHIEVTEDYSPTEGKTYVAWQNRQFFDYKTFDEAREHFDKD